MTEGRIGIALTLHGRHSAVLVGLVLERDVELLGLGHGEASHNHLGVGVDDAVEGEAGSLDRVLVHFVSFLLTIINL